MSTYLQLCRDFRADVGIEGTGPTTVINQQGMMQRLCYWIARADIEIQNKWANWNFLHSGLVDLLTANGDPKITKPVNLGLWDLSSFFYDKQRLAMIEYDVWRETYRYNTETGSPWAFTIDPVGNVLITPTPDGVYTINVEYWKTAQKMVLNDDVSLVPSDRAIIARASMFFAAQEEIPFLLQTATNEFTEIMRNLESKHLPSMGAYSTTDNDIFMELAE